MASRRQLRSASSNRARFERASKIGKKTPTPGPGRPLRRSPRLHLLSVDEISSEKAEQLPGKTQTYLPRPRPFSDHTAPFEPPQTILPSLQSSSRKRARDEPSSVSRKRLRKSRPSLISELYSSQERCTDPIDYWRRSGYHWPQEDLSQEPMDNIPAVSRVLARKKSAGSLRRKRSGSELPTDSSNTPSDQKSREAKSAPYRDARYETLLAIEGSFMGKSPFGINDASKSTYRHLLAAQQPVPRDTIFNDDTFEEICEAIRNRNESRVIRDISQLIVPSAERLAIRGDCHLRRLIESVNEGWNNSIPLTKTRPQPDFAVGFRREAFTEEQLQKLQPFVGDLTDQSFFMATYYQYFPFLTCEVKCGAAALDVADRQNAHSMSLAVRAVIELFRLVKREKELDREILAFSISHDHRSVRIYGHYAVIEETKINFYRHPIHTFDFTALDGKDKWTANKFTKSVYRLWMPSHFKRLCSVIDALPTGVSFDVSQQSELEFSDHTGLSQTLENQDFLTPLSESALSKQDNSQSQRLEPLDTPDTSFTKDSARGGTGKPKRGRH